MRRRLLPKVLLVRRSVCVVLSTLACIRNIYSVLVQDPFLSSGNQYISDSLRNENVFYVAEEETINCPKISPRFHRHDLVCMQSL